MSLSIRVHLLAGYLGALVLLVLAWAIAIVSTASLRADYARTVHTTDALATMVMQDIKLRDDEETGLRGYLLTDRRVFLAPYLAARSRLAPLRRDEGGLVVAEPNVRALMPAQRGAADAWDRWAQEILEHPSPYPRGSVALVAQQEQGKALFDRYRAATARIMTALDRARQRDFEAGMARLAAMNLVFAALFAGATALLALLGWRVTRAVLGPLVTLGRAATAIGQGEWSQRVAVRGAREFVRLARDMDAMRGELQAREAERLASAQRLRAVYEAMACGVLVLNSAAEVVEANEAARRILGLTPATIQGRFVSLVHNGVVTAEDGSPMPVEDQPGVRALRTRSAVQGVVMGLTRRDGRHCWLQVDTVPMLDAAGEPLYAVMSFIDITDRKRMEGEIGERKEELERSNAELQQFAYVASHDLQEPLRTVTSYLQLLERRYAGKLGADADDFIGFAIDGAQRMSALIKAVLDYSRVGSRGKELAPTFCADLVGDVVAALEATLAETGGRVTREDLPVVLGDERQLGQLFQNLIGNALKFRRPDVAPEVVVSAERRGDAWLFRVRDNGIGIGPEHAERIFQMFQRLHTRAEYEGTGIGLAVCKRIVERHHGRIWVESEPGRGAAFLFTLPAVDGQEERAA